MKPRLMVLLTTTLLVVAAASHAGIHKCVHPDGRISYQETDCPGEAATNEVELPKDIPPSQQDDFWSTENVTRRAETRPVPKPTKGPIKSALPSRARPSEVREAIMDKRVIRGMAPDEVREALGAPSSTYTTSDGYLAWDYATWGTNGYYKSLTLTFRGERLDKWSRFDSP